MAEMQKISVCTYGVFCQFCYKGAPRPSSSFVCRELKADSKVVVTDAETVPDSLTRVTVRVSTWMLHCNCHVHDAPETDSTIGYSFSTSVNPASVRLAETSWNVQVLELGNLGGILLDEIIFRRRVE
jgi:hypothetical protein